jgi:membrane protein implicated in regulation of membrane protease activity
VLVVAGIVLIVAGLLAWTGMLSWFGRLPGDIRIEREHSRIYVPFTSMIIVSVVLSVLVAVARRLK